MGSSPKDTSKKDVKKSPVQQSTTELPKPNDGDAKPVKPEETTSKTETTTTEPLAPPPRPVPQVQNTPDYFSGNHTLSHEANPFEFSFAGGASNGGQVQTPGGTKLPSVAALTSPAGILGGTTPNFWGGLRSGPLSPAMLSGPNQKEDYFSDGHHLRGGFPTPNESGLRSGLTPGGGGSMFPEPSPNSQALYASLASGGATPGTLDFHRTAMNAAAANKHNVLAQPNITSQPQDVPNGMEVKPPMPGQFDQHEANDAANGLYLLAQSRNGPTNTNHYAMAPHQNVHAHPQNMQMGGQSAETSPQMAHRNGGSISTNSGRGVSEMSDENENRPNTRGKNKRNATHDTTPINGRRKANEAPPAKAPANKKAKANNNQSMSMEPMSDEEQEENKGDEYHANGKKMTDEEKRKNFLERNRVAALKCRQRKKQWLANLQQKVEIYSVENDNLNSQLTTLREEIVNLKTILMAHKECPISQQGGPTMHQMVEGYTHNAQMNPYGMAMNGQAQQQQIMAGQGMQQRRYS